MTGRAAVFNSGLVPLASTPTAVGATLLGADYESSGGSHINFLQPADTDSVMIELVERPDTRR